MGKFALDRYIFLGLKGDYIIRASSRTSHPPPSGTPATSCRCCDRLFFNALTPPVGPATDSAASLSTFAIATGRRPSPSSTPCSSTPSWWLLPYLNTQHRRAEYDEPTAGGSLCRRLDRGLREAARSA